MQSQENNALISLRDVSLHRNGRMILSKVNLDIRQGDFLAVTGPNGGGKTSLLRIMLKLLKPSTGSVTYHDMSDGKAPCIGYLPQKNLIDSQFPITVEQVISSGLISKKLVKETIGERVESTLKLMGLEDRRNYTINRISGGQLQRTLIGRALISEPDLLVLDEPLSYLDKQSEAHIYDVIAGLEANTTIVLVSHEMSKIAQMANRHLIVERGVEECTAHHHYFTIDCPCPPKPHK